MIRLHHNIMLNVYLFESLILFLWQTLYFMNHNNDHPMATSQVAGIEGTTHGAIPIESYVLQIQNLLNFTSYEIFELWQSHGTLEAGVISIQQETNRLDECQGEPSFVVKPFT